MSKEIIVLDKNKKWFAYCDRNEYFKKYGIYDNNGYFKKLADGCPVIICICGSYYYLNKLSEIVIHNNTVMDSFIRECKSPIPVFTPPVFIWR